MPPCLVERLSPAQQQALLTYEALLRQANAAINLVSRKDVAQLMPHHIAPSLLLLCLETIPAGVRIVDVGTGGGLPGIPLAIALPQNSFLLIDSTRKKVEAVRQIVEALGLSERVEVRWTRVEDVQESFSYVVARAVAPLPKFLQWIRPRLAKEHRVFYYTGEPLPPLPPGWQYTYHPFRTVWDLPYLEQKGLLSLRYA